MASAAAKRGSSLARRRRNSGSFARRSSSAPAAPSRARRIGAGITKAAADQLARSARASGARIAREAVKQKSLLIGAGGAVAFGALQSQVNVPSIGPVPAGALYGAAGALAGLFIGGKVGEAVLFASAGPLYAGLAEAGRMIPNWKESRDAPTAVAGEYDDVGTSIEGEFDDVAGEYEAQVAGEFDDL